MTAVACARAIGAPHVRSSRAWHPFDAYSRSVWEVYSPFPGGPSGQCEPQLGHDVLCCTCTGPQRSPSVANVASPESGLQEDRARSERILFFLVVALSRRLFVVVSPEHGLDMQCSILQTW